VQVLRVMQPSAWQQEHSRVNRIQHELLDAATEAAAAAAK
jgi:formate dehydrogenase major subunit